MTKEEFFKQVAYMLLVMFILGLIFFPFQTIGIAALITLICSAFATILDFFD
jgi:hypothetical protein